MGPQTIRNRTHDFAIGEHADFHSGDFNVSKDRVNLRGDEGRGRRVHARNTARILGGERCDDRHAVTAKRCKSFQIRLNTGAARGVGARDGENIRRHGEIPLKRNGLADG